MKKGAVLFWGLLLSACGPSWEGTFTGDWKVSGNCSDGTGQTYTQKGSWAIEDKGEEIELSGGLCGDIRASVDGDVATLLEKTCPPDVTPEGFTTLQTLRTGRFSLDGNILNCRMESTILIAGNGGTGSCSLRFAGLLQRVK